MQGFKSRMIPDLHLVSYPTKTSSGLLAEPVPLNIPSSFEMSAQSPLKMCLGHRNDLSFWNRTIKDFFQILADEVFSVLWRLHSSFQRPLSNVCFLLNFRNYLSNAKKDFWTYLFRFNQALSVKLNLAKVGLFYQTIDRESSKNILYTWISKINWKCRLRNKNTIVLFLRINSTFLLSYKEWLSNIIFLS